MIDTVDEINDVTSMIGYLCSKTNLINCEKVSKQLSKTVQNAEKFNEYLTRITEFDPKTFLLEDLEWFANDVKQKTKTAVELKAEIEKDALLRDLSNVKNESDFKEVIQSLQEHVRPKSWWEKQTNWLADQFNYWWEKIKDFGKWLLDPKRLTAILILCWLLYCEYVQWREKKNNGQTNLRGRPQEIAKPDGITTACGATNSMLNLLASYAKSFFNIVWNAFKALFGLNKEYIIPQQFNPLTSAEEWDYTLSKTATEVGFGVGCGTMAVGSGLAGTAGGAVAAFFGVTAAPIAAVAGVAALSMSLVCGAGARVVNNTVVKPITNLEYVAMERALLRPALMILWDKIFNVTLETLKIGPPWKDRARRLVTMIMDLCDTLSQAHLAIMKKLKNAYVTQGMAAFKVGLNSLNLKYHLWQIQNEGKKDMQLSPRDPEATYVTEMMKNLPTVSKEQFEQLNLKDKYLLMSILPKLGCELPVQVSEKNINIAWKQNKKIIKQFYFDNNDMSVVKADVQMPEVVATPVEYNDNYEEMARRRGGRRRGGGRRRQKQRKGSCWQGYHRVPGTKQGADGSCAKNFQLKF